MKNLLMLLVLLMALAGSVYAGGAVWLGNLDPCDNDWTTDSNWQNGLPTSADPIYITYDWTNGINGPVINWGDAATADLVYLGWGGWGEGDTTMYMNGGTLDTREWWIGIDTPQTNPEAPGILEISDGNFINTGHLIISAGCNGTVNQTGGHVTTEVLVLDWLSTSNPEYGYYNLYGGTLDIGAGGLHLRPHGFMDIEEGVMTVAGDVTGQIAALISTGQLTAYSGTKAVLHDYNTTTPGKTTVQTGDTWPPGGGGVWYGNTDPCNNLWAIPSNWQGGYPPTSADTAHINYDWTDGINGPIVQAGNVATADLVILGAGGWGEGTTTMYMTGGTMDTREWWIGKDDSLIEPNAPGVLEISGGVLTNTGGIIISAGSSGTVNQTGGSVTTEALVLDWQITTEPEYGYYNLHAGTLDVGGGGLHVRPHGFIDIEEGVMTILGNATENIHDLVTTGQITAYGGLDYVVYDYDITNADKTTVWASETQTDGFKITADTGWNIFTNVGADYRYGPSFIINDDGSIDMWTASPGSGGPWDFIRHKKSTDGGLTWAAETIALSPTPGSADRLSTCDPGVIKFGGYYYIGYTSIPDEVDNDVFVARSTSPTGPYDKWNGSGWGGNPQPIIEYTDPCGFGAGEPSFVVKDGTLYIYYTWSGVYPNVRLATADASNPNWPSAMTFHGTVFTKSIGSDSVDVKYAPAVDKFIAVNTAKRLSEDSYVQVWTSSDGLTFTITDWTLTNILPYCHNMGISGDEVGHINSGEQHFIAYAYGPDWGQWSTHLSPVTICDTDYAMDFNCDCIVGFADFAEFAVEWQQPGPMIMDFDKSGIVGVSDLAEFLQYWLENNLLP